jgi:glycosyltransferase involved in cell wall biosynthesis
MGIVHEGAIVRIGLVLYGNLAMQSGGFLYDRLMVKCLQERGDDVEVISLPWVPYGQGLRMNLSRATQHRLTHVCPDLLLQDELAHPSLFFLNRRVKPMLNCPFIAIVHHLKSSEARPAWQNRLYRRVEKAYLRSMDGFIFNSRHTQRSVAYLIRNEKPAVVAYPGGDRLSAGISQEAVSARSFAEGPFRIVFLANITPRKELHTLVAGLSLLSEKAWELLVIGSEEADPSYARSVRQQVERAGLQPQVIFLGQAPDKEVAKILAKSHLLAVPSSYEGFGIVYPEAMSFALPVIASHAGGANEIVSHGVNGFLVNPGDAGALAQHVHDLIHDRERLHTMSIAALLIFLSQPTWAETGSSIHAFLHSFRV